MLFASKAGELVCPTTISVATEALETDRETTSGRTGWYKLVVVKKQLPTGTVLLWLLRLVVLCRVLQADKGHQKE